MPSCIWCPTAPLSRRSRMVMTRDASRRPAWTHSATRDRFSSWYSRWKLQRERAAMGTAGCTYVQLPTVLVCTVVRVAPAHAPSRHWSGDGTSRGGPAPVPMLRRAISSIPLNPPFNRRRDPLHPIAGRGTSLNAHNDPAHILYSPPHCLPSKHPHPTHGLWKPRFGTRRRSGTWPPSNPARGGPPAGLRAVQGAAQ